MSKPFEAKEEDWETDVLTRDYYPTRFEYLYKDILCGMLSRVHPKDEDKCIRNAIRYAKLAEIALDEAQNEKPTTAD